MRTRHRRSWWSRRTTIATPVIVIPPTPTDPVIRRSTTGPLIATRITRLGITTTQVDIGPVVATVITNTANIKVRKATVTKNM